ncbi:MAG: glycerol-3-phosphate acyltransferase [Dehalococcoidia bacterium]
MLAVAIIGGSYLIGSIPVAYAAGRLARGIDIREYGSGNAGASNIWQSVSKTLVVPVGLAQIAQGCIGPGAAWLLDEGQGVQVAAAVAAVLANDWNPWLGFGGGRGVGTTIGALIVLSPAALVSFIVIAVAGVGVRAIPQGVALGLLATPFAALVAGQSPAIVLGCALLAAIAFTKRLLANGTPAQDEDRLGVYVNRLLYDRDIRDREAWVRRELESGPQRSRGA